MRAPHGERSLGEVPCERRDRAGSIAGAEHIARACVAAPRGAHVDAGAQPHDVIRADDATQRVTARKNEKNSQHGDCENTRVRVAEGYVPLRSDAETFT